MQPALLVFNLHTTNAPAYISIWKKKKKTTHVKIYHSKLIIEAPKSHQLRTFNTAKY